LRRQVARLFRDEPMTPAVERLLDAVDAAYRQADEDRRLMERSLELTSEELLTQNQVLMRALEAEQTRRTMVGRLHDALARLATLLAEGLDLDHCMQRICVEVVEALDVDRASIWRFDDRAAVMHCLTSFDRTGQGLRVEEAPIGPEYISALGTSRVLVFDDLQESAMWKLVAGLAKGEVMSGMVAPCRIGGHVIGVVHIDHGHGRGMWSADEQLFAASVADCVSLTLESYRRRREEELRSKLEADLQQRQRMDSVGMLAGGIAHDFNNLLVPIIGNTELILETLGLTGEDRELVEEIREAGNSARDLVAQLLAFSRKQVLHLRDIDLAEEARKVTRLLVRALPKTITIELDFDGTLPVHADPGQIQQVILNLVVNAKDAMPHGGQIRVVGRRGEQTVVLSIEDTGTGMNEATLGKVFEPFFTTKELGRGTGLGLSTAYGIVEQHGGTLTATSELGQGSRFVITLPMSSSTAASAGSGRARRSTSRQREAVLLVEDEPMVLAVIKRLLTAEGFQVLAAGGPEEALLLAARHPEIELVITDVVMPVMNGKTMVDQILHLLPHVGTLYMSGYDNEVLAPQGVAIDDVDLVRKPFSGDELLAAVKRSLERAQQRSA
jgi:signal transduction histidine kinase/ActR/RegA family two-component response regulator